MTVQPWWLDDALRQEGAPQAPLAGEFSADICIVGGGFTGLWTAIQLRLAQPNWHIVVLEKACCGSGASGRNGGCMLTWSTKYLSLRRLFGEAEARRLVEASEQAVGAIAAFCQAHSIDAELRLGGALYAASNTAQQGILAPALAALDGAGINHWQTLDDAQTTHLGGSALLSHGAYSPLAGSLHPGKLVRGLLQVARKIGIEVHEYSAVDRIHESNRVELITAGGRIRATQAVLATNAETARFSRALANTMVLVSSDMVITEPCLPLIQQLGLDRGQSVCDLRTFVHYWRSTPDGRLMLGKGGNRIAYGNRLHAYFDQESAYRNPLQRTLAHFMPALAEVPIVRSWTGASDRSATGFPFFGRLPGYRNVFFGCGYSGNGVVQSYLGGQILSALLLGVDNAWTRSPLAQGVLARFPPEPLRWAGAMLVRGAIRRVERAQDAGRAPKWLDCRLATLADMAGKSG